VIAQEHYYVVIPHCWGSTFPRNYVAPRNSYMYSFSTPPARQADRHTGTGGIADRPMEHTPSEDQGPRNTNGSGVWAFGRLVGRSQEPRLRSVTGKSDTRARSAHSLRGRGLRLIAVLHRRVQVFKPRNLLHAPCAYACACPCRVGLQRVRGGARRFASSPSSLLQLPRRVRG